MVDAAVAEAHPTGRAARPAVARIAFYIHPDRPEAAPLAERAAAWLAEQGHRSIAGAGPGRVGRPSTVPTCW